jgi:TolB protein
MNKLVFIVFMLTMCFTVSAEKFDLEVYASKFDSIPIGLIDFKCTGGKALSENQPWKIIANDLDFCGKFNVLNLNEYDSAAFVQSNIGIYIDGDYSVEGTIVSVNCYLRDVSTKELIIGKKYRGELKSLRGMSHRYSDEIVEILFGDRGIFGSKIIFVNSSGANKNIGLMDFDGYNQVILTKNKVINIFPAFLDSSTFIWTSYLRGKPDIYKGSIFDGKSNAFIYSKAVTSSPDVSPIDATIAYASSKGGNFDIYTCERDGTNTRQLTVHYGVDTSPSWSPNGYQIAYTSDRNGNPQIFVMDADGANQHRLTFDQKYTDSPAWCPKGDKIAYMAMGKSGQFDIWTIAPDGTANVQVTSLSGSCEYPTWSPDGTLLGFINSVNGKNDFYVVKPDGSHLRRVTTSGNVKMPDWSSF